MAVTGRRSKLGSLHGPMNHENLNGTSSAMLAVQQFNSDVQIPYRLPICEETHAACCDNACWQVKDTQTMVQACQAGQDAQAGYACDYCAKRQPMAFNEIKECCKGHQSLNESVKDEKIGYVGKRHATRFMSDAYGKGIVRGQVENMNLRAYTDWSDVTFAETLSTAPCCSFFGSEFLKMVERLNDGADKVATALFPEVDKRNPQKRKVTLRDVATLYGQRPNHSDVWHLSPYEFTMYWKPVLATYPLSLDDLDAEHYHAALTDRGKQKLKNKDTNMQPGHDYEVKKGGFDWLAFPKVPSTQFFRNTWVLQRRRRPEVPTFFGAPIPRHHAGEHQRAAAIVMTYFHPWTLRKQDADEDVTYAGALRPNGQTWQEAMEEWFDGRVLCREAKQYVGNFLSIHRMRPRDDDLDDDGNSQDIVSDEELEISRATLHDALITRIGGREHAATDEKSEGASHFQNSTAAIELNQSFWDSSLDNKDALIPSFVQPSALKDILAAAKTSQRREHQYGAASNADSLDPALRQLAPVCPSDVDNWLKLKKKQRDANGRLVLNAEQYAAVKRVTDRVKKELQHAADDKVDPEEPLRWLVHGGPGTGKSHVIKQVREFFQDVLHWDMGINFQVVALQAVMADMLGGDTIHHACGIPVFKGGQTADFTTQKQSEVAKRVLQWRWLIIDEISMVSAKLLAEIDVKLRSAVRALGTQKHDSLGADRPFGGLNVLFCGDFWQLEPPDGGFLAGIPTEFIRAGRKYRLLHQPGCLG